VGGLVEGGGGGDSRYRRRIENMSIRIVEKDG